MPIRGEWTRTGQAPFERKKEEETGRYARLAEEEDSSAHETLEEHHHRLRDRRISMFLHPLGRRRHLTLSTGAFLLLATDDGASFARHAPRTADRAAVAQ